MNSYRISYSSPGNETRHATVTAPDNRTAERAFKASFKESGLPAPDIFHIELVSKNALPTKDQEREALEKIKAIIETLGQDSYVATAFEGCIQDAEENIEKDFALSMKDRWLTADRKLNEAYGTIEELRNKLRESEKAYEADHDTATRLVEEKNAEIAALSAKVLSDDDMTDCTALLQDRISEHQEDEAAAANAIVDAADDPTSEAFTQAVREHRNAKKAVEYCEAIYRRLKKAAGQ